MKFIKIIALVILLLVLAFASYYVYMINFYKEIPLTQANVNDNNLGEVVLQNDQLVNFWEDSTEVEVGNLTVSENRNSDSSNKILLNFVRFKTQSSNPKAPIFFLAGGPGTGGTQLLKGSYFYIFKELSVIADVIVLDQRGTGNSIPNLTCRNDLSMPTDISENVQEQIFKDVLEKCQECANEFQDLGIDLTAYSSKESVEDLEELRMALEYDSISFIGYSYGTALAQHYIRKYDKNVSSAVLAGILPPDIILKSSKRIESQYEQMDSLIKVDKRFQNYIPDFMELVQTTHNRLDERPYLINIPLMDAVDEGDGWLGTTIFKTISIFKPYWKIQLTKEHMQIMMAQNTGTFSWTRSVPYYYYNLQKDDAVPLGNYLRNFRRQSLPNALFFTEGGTTGYDEEEWNQLVSENNNILSHFSISFGRYQEIYDAFGVSKIDGLNEPVRSDIPALLIGGTLDGRTPLSNLDSVYRRFPNARKIIIENTGHNGLIDSDVLSYMIDFYQGNLTSNIKLERSFEFATPVPYKKDLVKELEKERNNNGIDSAVGLYLSIRKEFSDQNDFYYDFSEGSLNAYGYELLGNDKVDDAIKIFELNCSQFPDRHNPYNSLAEAYIQKRDTVKAISNLKKAISLNSLDGYSISLLKQLL